MSERHQQPSQSIDLCAEACWLEWGGEVRRAQRVISNWSWWLTMPLPRRFIRFCVPQLNLRTREDKTKSPFVAPCSTKRVAPLPIHFWGGMDQNNGVASVSLHSTPLPPYITKCWPHFSEHETSGKNARNSWDPLEGQTHQYLWPH